MKTPLLKITIFIVFAQTCFSQNNLKKSELLIGKWEVYTYNYLEKGKWVHKTGGGRSLIEEFKKDGTLLSSRYEKDSLVEFTTGNWQFDKSDTIRYFNLKYHNVQNVVAVSTPNKLIRVNDTLLVLSTSLFISRDGSKPKNNYIYYKRVK